MGVLSFLEELSWGFREMMYLETQAAGNLGFSFTENGDLVEGAFSTWPPSPAHFHVTLGQPLPHCLLCQIVI